MTESSLTLKLMEVCEKIMPFAKVLKHSDRSNSGYPDTTVTWHRFTSWWEIKFYDDRMFKSPPQQETMCRQLAEQGCCHYIIYEIYQGVRGVSIVHPRDLKRWKPSVPSFGGHSHASVASFIRRMHEHMLG